MVPTPPPPSVPCCHPSCPLHTILPPRSLPPLQSRGGPRSMSLAGSAADSGGKLPSPAVAATQDGRRLPSPLWGATGRPPPLSGGGGGAITSLAAQGG
uniref:Uncharacterized protein n=1 Tax=Arundo donax TaxID=35708 RepID=A0A0A8YNF4_ARUDO